MGLIFARFLLFSSKRNLLLRIQRGFQPLALHASVVKVLFFQ